MDYQLVAKDACAKIEEAVGMFCLEGEPCVCSRYGNGHINDTFLLVCRAYEKEQRYILQRMNTAVFQDPKGLMGNVSGVTAFLREEILRNGGDADRETLTLVPTRQGLDYYEDSIGSWWRVYLFIEDAISYDVPESEADFYQSARAFGRFQKLLEKYPVEKLTETIADFHNTPKRFAALEQAVAADVCGRVSEVQSELAFVMARKEELSAITGLLESGQMPYRVTHNDTKLNNIMLDNETREAICVIDLDTIMPGASAYDYGDSIRFGANTALEDETDLSKVSLSLPLFEAYTRGFLEECRGKMTKKEIEMLPWGAKLMTMECGIRFLTDYLDGDHYFRIHRASHNLDRCRTQFALVADMERKWADMQAIVAKAAAVGV